VKPTIAILCGGGPAPGINAVISTVAKVFLNSDYRVLGIHEGYKGLFSENPDTIDFDFKRADEVFNRGGSVLIMSRFKPRNEDFNVNFFIKNNIKLLVTIGGDDTAGTANRITNYLEKSNLDVKNIHVPKTIDNDLPLPERNPTFGFHSAKDEGVKIANTVYEDAITSSNWFVLSTMGRSAGHLALGIASACHLPMVIIPEMFNKTKISVDKIIRLMVSAILKRKIMRVDYGVILLSEGVFHILDKEEIEQIGVHLNYDEHNHPILGDFSKANVFNKLLKKHLTDINIAIKSRPVDLGYELRCCRPIGFDLTLCTLLGIGVKKLFDEGISGCIVTCNSKGEITPMYLNEFDSTDGKIIPRLVEVESEFAQLCFQNLHYLAENDYQSAKEYIDNPELYDFNKILNWST